MDTEKNKFQIFEKALWQVRWIVMLGVIANLVAGIGMVIIAMGDFYSTLETMYLHITSMGNEKSYNSTILQHLVEMVDKILLSGVLFIFAFGLYELFISKMDVGKDECEGKILNIRNIDELKSKLTNLIIVILTVKLFSYLSGLSVKSFEDGLLFAGAIALVALSSLLIHLGGAFKEHK